MSEPIVTVKNGKLRGKIAKNYDGNDYFSFQGIPYAKPPLGELRFKAPVASKSWEGIRDATKDGNNCININQSFDMFVESEDCLYLNVFTRQLPSECKTLKPVMVWIHGGAFTMGSGNSALNGPEYILTKDVVLVTLNYRLGLFGFLNFEDASLNVTGNAGLKDQVLALKWVQENISQFCGDFNNVTVFGVSAGAASVHYLMLSPLTKGLFHKCILQSGNAFASWAKGHRTLPYITEALNIKTTDEKEVLEILQKMSSDEISELQKKITEEFSPSFKRCFAPVVETPCPGAFLTEKPEEIILSGNYKPLPMLIGFTSREGLFSEFDLTGIKCDYVIKDFETKIPHTVNAVKGSQLSLNIANEIKSFYYNQHETTEENKLQYYLLHGDILFFWPTIMTIKYHNKTSNTPIYLYNFSADTKLNFVKNLFQCKFGGAAHGDDISYIFKMFMSPAIIPNSAEEKIIRKTVTFWTNFATNGDPNPLTNDSLININWKQIDGDVLHYMDIGENLTTGINPNEDRMKFWERITSIEVNKSKL